MARGAAVSFAGSERAAAGMACKVEEDVEEPRAAQPEDVAVEEPQAANTELPAETEAQQAVDGSGGLSEVEGLPDFVQLAWAVKDLNKA